MDHPIVRRASRAGSRLRSSVGCNNSRHDDGGYSATRFAPGTASRSAAVNPIKFVSTVPMRMSTMLPAYPTRANDSAARHAVNVPVMA
jgi:hypothetical protein